MKISYSKNEHEDEIFCASYEDAMKEAEKSGWINPYNKYDCDDVEPVKTKKEVDPCKKCKEEFQDEIDKKEEELQEDINKREKALAKREAQLKKSQEELKAEQEKMEIDRKRIEAERRMLNEEIFEESDIGSVL